MCGHKNKPFEMRSRNVPKYQSLVLLRGAIAQRTSVLQHKHLETLLRRVPKYQSLVL